MITIAVIACIAFIVPIGPELAVAGEDIILSDDEGAADDKPYYMTVNGKQARSVFLLPRVTVNVCVQREELKTSVEAKVWNPSTRLGGEFVRET